MKEVWKGREGESAAAPARTLPRRKGHEPAPLHPRYMTSQLQLLPVINGCKTSARHSATKLPLCLEVFGDINIENEMLSPLKEDKNPFC